MIPLPRTATCVFALALCLVAPATSPGEQPAEHGELSFLTPGKNYVIRFVEGGNIFKTMRGGVTQSTLVGEDGEKRSGRPATWSMTLAITHFHVVRVGSGSWALLRHAAAADDFAKWNGKLRAQAILADEARKAEIESEPDGQEKLKRLQEAAQREIETSETWVNLHHAVAITDVPTQEVKLKLTVKSATIKDND